MQPRLKPPAAFRFFFFALGTSVVCGGEESIRAEWQCNKQAARLAGPPQVWYHRYQCMSSQMTAPSENNKARGEDCEAVRGNDVTLSVRFRESTLERDRQTEQG